jgi:hypothetical protein
MNSNTHGGRRIAGKGKTIGRPKTKQGTLILVSVRIQNQAERERINQLTPAERTAVLLQAVKEKSK